MTEITLLDGSIGQEIVKRSGDRPTFLWSTSVMIEKPGIVGNVHSDYFAAGATVATTNSYALHRDRLERVDMLDQFEALIERSLTEAEAARTVNGGGRIAGALGPLGASYRVDVCPEPDMAAGLFSEIVTMMDHRVDLFVIETVVSLKHAEGALRGTAKASKPIWLAVSVDDDDGTVLRSGEAVADLAEIVNHHAPQAVLVNCSRPEAIASALDIIKGFGRPFGAYANGFTRISEGFLKDAPTVEALQERVDLDPMAYARFAMGWVDQGATIVGGCCEVGPAHIAELARQLRTAGHAIV
ncbi:Homocysteine S-methyltransferase [Roseovarius litorisediminis]|uniref:Homocysteine S-methyltransferase n=1 Tax=Roseovarius litorisediminis TaxID=1312363 RepID=A0A1Y5S0R6_9RHOB|nr:homocysteine S-methyltransferase family protein [Roseovarius litorisediminis]SLN29432.1 Homocysteine S-methyltransferase [Roseovarius litorisediminis]